MKNRNLIAACFVCLWSLSASAQVDKEESKSHADQFTAKSGRLLKKEFVKVGKVKNAEIQVLNYLDLMTDEGVSVLRFEMEVATSYSSDTKIGSLDSDEVDGLVKSMGMIINEVSAITPSVYTEVIYTSRSGFEAGCYWSSKQKQWKTYFKLEKYDTKSMIYMEMNDFESVLSIIKGAIPQMKY